MGDSKNVQLVKVYVRQRPFTAQEIELKRPSIVKEITQHEITVKSNAVEKKYSFDRVFRDDATQEEVYETVVAPCIEFILAGYTCTVFAYGQTGTGKTHTMIGQNVTPNINFINEPSVGMVPRAAISLFSSLEKLNVDHAVTVSFIEIYNEEVRDLLVKDSVPLKIYDDPDNKGSICVRGLTERKAADVTELHYLLALGSLERQTAQTNLNRNSSRSHTIFTVVVNTRETTLEGEEIIKTGKLHLIDLAGSENIGRSGATEMRAREAGTINKSLLTLGKVIKALALKMQHVPYRESKLTRILQDSLGGTSKTHMIATFSPTVDCFDETISTLDYAHVARSVANCPTVNVNRTKTNLLKCSHEELAKLRKELQAARAGEGFYMNTASYEKMELENKMKNERILILVKEIQHLEEHIRNQQLRFEELNESFLRTKSRADSLKDELEKKTLIQRKNQYVTNYLTGKIVEMTKLTKQYLDVCESSTKHEEIFRNKYEKQCNLSLYNANVANSVSSTACSLLKECEASKNHFVKGQENYLSEARTRAAAIKENQVEASELLDGHSTELNSKAENYKLKFEALNNGDSVHSTFRDVFDQTTKANIGKIVEAQTQAQSVKGVVFNTSSKISTDNNKCLNLLQEASLKHTEHCSRFDSSIHNLISGNELRTASIKQRLAKVRSLKEHYATTMKILEAKIKNGKAEAERLAQQRKIVDELISQNRENGTKGLTSMKEALTSFSEIREPITRSLHSLEDLAVSLENKKISFQTNTDLADAKTENYFNKIVSASEDYLTRHNIDLETQLTSWASNVDSVKEKLQKTVEEHGDALDYAIKQLAKQGETHDQEVDTFSSNASTRVTSFESKIESKVHEGDTPVKPVYSYPKEIEETIPEEVLREHFAPLQSDSPTTSC